MMADRLAKGRERSSPGVRHTVPLDVLVVDDDQATRLSVAYALGDAGHRVTEASDGEEALALAAERTFDVAILDVRLPAVDGLTIFRNLRVKAPATSVILMTAFATIADAVASLREGAYDYVTKPFDAEEFTLRVIGHIAEHRALRQELEEARRLVATREVGSPIIGHSPAMVRLIERINTMAQSDAPVLIRGETGSGKDLVAHTLHARSRRRDAPFVTVDCSAFPERVLDVELFGVPGASSRHQRGRFEAAEGGTVLLDRIGHMPLATQAKLAQFLEEGQGPSMNVRVLASTVTDLREAASEGRFREDLFLRLNVLDLDLPPLRERRADLPLLLAHFLKRFYPGRVPPSISPRAWSALLEHSFPGNVREFAHAIERAAVLSHGSEIDLEHLPADLAACASSTDLAPLSGGTRITPDPGTSARGNPESRERLMATTVVVESLESVLKACEREHIVHALRVCAGSREHAAEVLGITPALLDDKIGTHGIVVASPDAESAV